jgi:hypothetical protein
MKMFKFCCFKILLLKFLFCTGKNTLELNKTCKENITRSEDKYTKYIMDEAVFDYILILHNFNTYKEIVLSCNFYYYITYIKSIYLMPKTSLILDESLRIDDLFHEDNFHSIHLLNLKGIAFFQTKLPLFQLSLKVYFHFVSSSSFKSFILSNNQTTPMTLSQCNEKALQNMTTFIQPLISLTFENFLYPREGFCSFMFKQSIISNFRFGNIYNSFLIENRLSFMKTNYSRTLIMSNLEFIDLDLFYEKLTSRVLNVNLFENVKHLNINLHLLNIEHDLLSKFNRLKYIDIRVFNLREFFQTENTQWLKGCAPIGSGVIKFQLVRFVYVTSSFLKAYEYPDEDLCLFKDFPHSRFYLPIIMPGERIACTCSLKWLQMHYENYTQIFQITNNYKYFQLDEDTFLSGIKYLFRFCDENEETIDCDFERLFNTCNITTTSTTRSHSELNDIDFIFLIKWLQFILLVILAPMFGIIGLINNILILLTIGKGQRLHEKKAIFKDPMYKHIQLNAFFNILSCLIMCVSLLNSCIASNTHSLYCSSVYMTQWAQYFKIIVNYYLGYLIRTCSKMSYVSFSFIRFICVANLKESRGFQVFFRLNIKLYAVCLIVFSALLSLFRLFQYEIITWKYAKGSFDFPLESVSEVLCVRETNWLNCKVIDTFKIVYKSFNDIVLFILNILIDILLVKYYNKQILKKIKMRNANADNSDLMAKKKKINQMVIVNSVVFLVSHMPEFVITILLYVYKRKIERFCRFFFSCDLISHEAEFFNSISIMCTFYILLIFDRNFKESFHHIFKKN